MLNNNNNNNEILVDLKEFFKLLCGLFDKATLGFYNLHVIRDLSTLFPYSGSHKDQFIEQMEAEGQLDPYLDPSIVHCY
jgi:hypothetical protein